MPQIICKNAAFAYDNAIAVSGLDFVVQSGDYLCIVGENGSGKSTLVKGLLGLMKPAGGSIEFGDGLDSNEIGYLPQQTVVQKDFPASVYEVVLSGRLASCGIRPFYSAADKAEAEANMALLGISGLRDSCYRELSGGQQQRVLLARALCATRKLLVLDEPVAGLDPVATQDLYVQIEKINKETGITVVMVSHDVKTAVAYASHILHLKNRQAFFGPAGDYAETAIGKRFLGGDSDV
ncbi:MAG: ABC transporter ATP-binding protein [Clostridiales bacterium]|nr:ABC transporter ATP-binding protein [Clostridiales bacterium]